jgi:hypothetical protein
MALTLPWLLMSQLLSQILLSWLVMHSNFVPISCSDVGKLLYVTAAVVVACCGQIFCHKIGIVVMQLSSNLLHSLCVDGVAKWNNASRLIDYEVEHLYIVPSRIDSEMCSYNVEYFWMLAFPLWQSSIFIAKNHCRDLTCICVVCMDCVFKLSRSLHLYFCSRKTSYGSRHSYTFSWLTYWHITRYSLELWDSSERYLDCDTITACNVDEAVH